MINFLEDKRQSVLEDKRVVYNKYDQKHVNKLDHAILKCMPESIDTIGAAVNAVNEEMEKHKIVMYTDSQMFIFNKIWDNLPEELKAIPEEEAND